MIFVFHLSCLHNTILVFLKQQDRCFMSFNIVLTLIKVRCEALAFKLLFKNPFVSNSGFCLQNCLAQIAGILTVSRVLNLTNCFTWF